MMMTRKIDSGNFLILALMLLVALPAARTVAAQEAGHAAEEYVVKRGDTLFNIARRFETSVLALKRANGLTSNEIQIGQTLMLPAHSVATRDSTHTVAAVPGPSESDSTRRGDEPPVDSSLAVTTDSVETSMSPEIGLLELVRGQSLYDVAFATGLTVDSLLKLNPGVKTFLPDSARLLVPADFASVRYTVKPGDTLYRIARAMDTTVDAIRSTNRLTGDVIHVGQVLTVPSSRLTGRASPELPVLAEGEARIYPDRFAGRLTASGRPYDPDEFTVSHRDLPIGSIVLVSVPGTERRTFAHVTDRLPGSAEYLIDASEAVMNALRSDGESNLRVDLRVVRFGGPAPSR